MQGGAVALLSLVALPAKQRHHSSEAMAPAGVEQNARTTAMTPTSGKVERGKQTADGEGAGLLLPYPRRFDPKFTIFFEF